MGASLSPEAKELRKEYYKNWRKANREKVNEYQKKWRNSNKEKAAKNQANYWERKAETNRGTV